MNAPLAERMRPKTLDQYIGQQHLLAPNASLRRALDAGVIPSMIFWGPPGVGKTTLAQLIAQHLNRPIHTLSAISSGVKDVREVIAKVQGGGMFSPQGSILFIDEIHRFSIITLLERAIKEDHHLQKKKISLLETNALLRISGGDARKLLNVFEIIIGTFQGQTEIDITDDVVLANAQQSLASYDKDGEQHYDIISAFIKSVRGSDPNAAVYWLARMVEGGEDPKFIARRLVILAAEDIGLANPNALLLANACFQAVENVGWPESRIILSECTLYLASSPKGNAAYMAINKAQQIVQQTGNLGVPLALRNSPTKLMKELGYGDGYQYSHDHPGNFYAQEFLPEQLVGTNFFHSGSSPKEQEIAQQIKKWWQDKYKF
ncbi:MAG: replication-associated recombination protein A [Cryomorphaceae bacterium]|nr:replication-associated recombination protein A [Cryomorphaceae bacterium]